ncbi:cobalt transporter CbiM [Leptolyngbya sp. AN02str]|uniref:cobalt transporter CbiM n=1 Tax=Leptolyngbya sp. AN02str TaxID=3423363 RepID=UPI003D31FEE0
MHLPDGFLPAPLCIGGYGLTGLATWYSLRHIHRRSNPTEDIPKASLLTAAFFVASSIYIPIPPTSVHLVLNGLLGTVLGWYAFPAILIGLFFQAVMFGHGGLTTLGANAVMMGLPALLAGGVFRGYPYLQRWLKPRVAIALSAFMAGAVGLGLALIIFIGLTIVFIPQGFDAATERTAIYALVIAHGPLLILEGVFTAALVLFLQRVKPEMMRHAASRQASPPTPIHTHHQPPRDL